MIYTVTLNPSVDYVVDIDNFRLGKINRTSQEQMFPGGKGINVSIMLHNLGIDSVATGFVGGFSGDFIVKSLDENGIKNHFINIDGTTRINVKINGSYNGEETAINGRGPVITNKDIDELLLYLDNLNDSDILVLSGSIPIEINSDIYSKILSRLSNKEIISVVDTTGRSLFDTLKNRPFLVKPNKEELEDLFGIIIKNDDDLIKYASKINKFGAKYVIVSLGKDGALLVGDDINPLKIPAPKIDVVSTVGAGDSLIAGFIYEYVLSKDVVEAFKMGVAAGSAKVMSSKFPDKDTILKIKDEI